MKNLFKMFGIAAIAAVIGFSMACATPAPVDPETEPEISVTLAGEVFGLDPNDIDAPQAVATITVKHPVEIKDYTIQVESAAAIARAAARAAEQQAAQESGEQAESPARERRQQGPFFEVKGEGSPPAEWKWDGKSSRQPRREGAPRAQIQSATDYQITVTVTDIFGNTGTYTGALSTDVLVIKSDDTHYKIIVPNIVFPGNSADLSRVSEQDQRSNTRILRLIARALNRFPDYKVIIEGHSNPENAPGTPARQTEETRELIPLSDSRAKAVLEWLVSNGEVDRARLSAVGRGGTQVLVAFDEDPDERANNRRVEFLLEK